MPRATRRSKFSWKTNHARTAVATPSRVRSSEAAAASVCERPVMSSNGPTIPPATIAPPSHGISAGAKRCFGCCLRRQQRLRHAPQNRDADASAAIKQAREHGRIDSASKRFGRRCGDTEQSGGQKGKDDGVTVHEARIVDQDWRPFPRVHCVRAAGPPCRISPRTSSLRRIHRRNFRERQREYAMLVSVAGA